MFKKLTASFVIFWLSSHALADCQDVTLDRCSGNAGIPPFQTLTLSSEETCQEYCHTVFTEMCTFFIYDREQDSCQLFDFDSDVYASSCTIVGGTPMPSLTECQNSGDKCLVRTNLDLNILILILIVTKTSQSCYNIDKIWILIWCLYKKLYQLTHAVVTR